MTPSDTLRRVKKWIEKAREAVDGSVMDGKSMAPYLPWGESFRPAKQFLTYAAREIDRAIAFAEAEEE